MTARPGARVDTSLIKAGEPPIAVAGTETFVTTERWSSKEVDFTATLSVYTVCIWTTIWTW